MLILGISWIFLEKRLHHLFTFRKPQHNAKNQKIVMSQSENSVNSVTDRLIDRRAARRKGEWFERRIEGWYWIQSNLQQNGVQKG